MKSFVAFAVGIGACSLLASPSAFAGEIEWASATSGTFSDGAPWVGGVPPMKGDGAVFGASGGYIVSLFADAVAGYVAIDGSSPVFEFPGSRLDLTFIGNMPVSLSLGRTAGSTSSLLHTDGRVVGETMYVAEAAGSTATVTIAGADTRFSTLARLDVGHEGQGMVSVLAGALADSGLIFVGALPGSDGTLRVSGVGSRVETGLLVVGGEGQGDLMIQSGGFVSSTGVRVGDTNGSGDLSLSGSGSELDATGADVKIADDGDGTLTFSAGLLRARDLILGIDAGVGTATASSGTFFLTRDFVIGNSGTAEVTLNGSHGTICERLRIGTGTTSDATLNLDTNLVATVGVDIAPGTFNLGTLALGPSGVVTSPLARLFSNGRLTGSGEIIGNVESSGLVTPAGVMLVTGDYTQDGLLNAGAFAAEAGSVANTLDVSGVATLTGSFSLTVEDGFEPMTGESFVMLRAGMIAGDFSSYSLPNADWSAGIVGNEVVATFNGVSGDPADLDQSGDVGASDLAILLAAWGACPGCGADLDGNGSVGASDLAILLAAWG